MGLKFGSKLPYNRIQGRILLSRILKLVPARGGHGGVKMGVLADLEPERVFYFFEEITKIPHGSGNVGQISDYLANFARERGIF